MIHNLLVLIYIYIYILNSEFIYLIKKFMELWPYVKNLKQNSKYIQNEFKFMTF